MKNLVELNQEEIDSVSGAGIISDLVGNLGQRFNFGQDAKNAIDNASERTQQRLTQVGLPEIAKLIKFIV